MSPRLTLLVCTILFAILPGAALAQQGFPAELTWLCWLETRDGFFVRCRQDEDPLFQAIAEDDAIVPAALMQPVDNRAIRQEIFKPGHAPNVSRLVRGQPAQYAALTWSIPLHGMPFDDSPLRELAQSVMCGSDRNCSAFLGRPELPAQTVRMARR
jgi:hypothetical protein